MSRLLPAARAGGLALFIALCISVSSAAAQSAPPAPGGSVELTSEPRVLLIVRTRGDDELLARVRAELVAGEWQVVELRPDESSLRAPLAGIAAEYGAHAALRLDAGGRAIEVFSQRPDGAFEETISARSDGTDDLVVLRAVEALRAPSVGAEPEKAPPAEAEPEIRPVPVQKPTPEARRPPPLEDGERASALFAGAGAGALFSPGGAGGVGAAALSLRFESRAAWSIGAAAFLPVTAQEVSGDEGSARLRSWLVGGSLDFAWLSRPNVALRSGAGAAAALVTMTGSGIDGYRGVSDSVSSAVPFVQSAIDAKLSEHFRLCSSVLVGASLPRVRVQFGAREAASFGQPLVAVALALDVRALVWPPERPATKSAESDPSRNR